MNRAAFSKLSLHKKLGILQKDGEFIANRLFNGFQVGLFVCNGFYVELWKRIDVGEIMWIEVVDLKSVEKHLDNIELPKGI